ncbi:MAG: type II methionyl aminopeptidase [Candidatus Geothermarchaeales archaeon]
MDENGLESLLRAGKINAEALRRAEIFIRSQKRINLLELCDVVEEFIIQSEAFPAFPCNIGINEVAAHFSPLRREDGDLPREGIVKVDVGVRIDGHIVDSAISLPLSPPFRDMVGAARSVLAGAVSAIYPGERTGKIGELIERAASVRNYRPISNLSGHMIGEYNLHAGKSIPNVRRLVSPTIEVGEVYAVEPFITLLRAQGRVRDRTGANIFRIGRFKKPKDKRLGQLYDRILQRCRGLPFSPRWFVEGELGLPEVLGDLGQLQSLGIVRSYPILVERTGMPVAQYEHTVLVEEGGARVLTG